MVLDDTRAYWFSVKSSNLSELHAIDHLGTTYQTLATLPLAATAMALSTSSVVAVSYEATGSSLWVAPKTSGTFQLLGSEADGYLGGNVHENAAVSGGYAFWAGGDGIYRVPLAGGTSELWVKTSCVFRLLADADTVFWSCYQGNVAWKQASEPPDLAFGYSATSASPVFGVDATHLYYFGSGGLFRKPKSGGTGELVVAGAKQGAWDPFAVDDANLYWGQWAQAVGSSSPLHYAQKQTGSQPIVLADVGAQVEQVASNGVWVYWINNASRLFRTPRP